MAELSCGAHSDSAAEDTLGDEFTGSFFGELMKNVSSFDQGERLAHNLNLPNSEIEGLRKDVQNDPVLFGIKVLKKWDSNHPHETFEDARRELALKLEQSGLKRQAKRVWPQKSRVKSPQTSRPHTPVSNLTHAVREIRGEGGPERVPLLPENPVRDQGRDGEEDEDEEAEDAPPVRRNLCHCSYKWIGCYGAFLISFLLMTAALIVLYEFPTARNYVQPIYAKANDTVELDFNLDYVWLEQVTLDINDECVGSIFVVQGTSCSEVPILKEFGVDPSSHEPVYLVSGSQILISIPDRLEEEVDVWITRGGYESTQDYENYGCNDHPSNMVCLEANYNSGLYVYNVTETSYYTVTFKPHKYYGITWNFTAVKYNYMQLLHDKVEDLKNDNPATVALGNQFNYHKMCMLLHVSADSCNAPYYGKLTVTNISRRQDILILPGLTMGVILVVLCFVAVLHCAYARFKYNAARNDVIV